LNFSDFIPFIFPLIVVAYALWKYLNNRAARQSHIRPCFEHLEAEAREVGSKARLEAEAEAKAELEALLRVSRSKEGSP
jgi:hypothetical protein